MPTFSIPIQHTEFVSLCSKKQQILFLPLHSDSGLRLIILGKGTRKQSRHSTHRWPEQLH